MRIGILMGGSSREREISFAGGRTVFDTLDRNIFQPVPIFIDSFHRFILLEEQYLYRGTIKDFFPPSSFLPDTYYHYAIEHLYQADTPEYEKVIQSTGQEIPIPNLSDYIDFAFLTLHGSFGEDGTIQGLLEWLKIPYSGTGIYGSALGMNKINVRSHLENNQFATPKYSILALRSWIHEDKYSLINEIINKVELPCVIKNPYQGSSIGISIAQNENELIESIEKCFFRKSIDPQEWQRLSVLQKQEQINHWSDARTDIGLPVFTDDEIIIHSPTALFEYLEKARKEVILTAHDTPDRLLIESFISGTEISVIVIEDESGHPVALPPTEIVKNQAVFDYHDKYLSGSVHKYTPARLPDEVLFFIQKEAERLVTTSDFEVFSRIDGILSEDGNTIYFNDPNTTSGMLPGSFLFHQAAEVGFTPTRFLTYLIEKSLIHRFQNPNLGSVKNHPRYQSFLGQVSAHQAKQKINGRIAVIMGGYSSEKHISVESGRNVYQKIISAGEYTADPIFLLHQNYLGKELSDKIYPDNPEFFTLWSIPIAVLLKDNADDITCKITDSVKKGVQIPTVVYSSRERLKNSFDKYHLDQEDSPRLIRFDELGNQFDFVFIALHGRPGEDGYLKAILEKLNLPYNGSGVEASALTMDKFQTNERLKQFGFHIPKHLLINKETFASDLSLKTNYLFQEIGNKLIAKPNDEGCSTDVQTIDSEKMLISYGNDYFRNNPSKDSFLIEELIRAENDSRLVEITIGFVSEVSNGKQCIHVFEPSETVSKASILSLEEKFLAGEGQNITPARLSTEGVNSGSNLKAIADVKKEIEKAIIALNLYGYARIDAFVVLKNNQVEKVIFIEVNSLPGMTPATCIFHQAALSGYSPYRFIHQIIQMGIEKNKNET